MKLKHCRLTEKQQDKLLEFFVGICREQGRPRISGSTHAKAERMAAAPNVAARSKLPFQQGAADRSPSLANQLWDTGV